MLAPRAERVARGICAFHPLPTFGGRATISRMGRIDAKLVAQLPLKEVAKVTFYKRDEITSDLICCEVAVAGKVWTFHEELDGWDLLMNHLESLPGFRRNWFEGVSQPPFAPSQTIAFSRD